MAKLLKIEKQFINIKATTAEKKWDLLEDVKELQYKVLPL